MHGGATQRAAAPAANPNSQPLPLAARRELSLTLVAGAPQEAAAVACRPQSLLRSARGPLPAQVLVAPSASHGDSDRDQARWSGRLPRRAPPPPPPLLPGCDRRPTAHAPPPLQQLPVMPMPLASPKSSRAVALALLLAAAILACAGAVPPPAVQPQAAASSGPDPLRRPTSWDEAWAALAPYRLSPAAASAAPCSAGPTVAAACGVRGRGAAWACTCGSPLHWRCCQHASSA